MEDSARIVQWTVAQCDADMVAQLAADTGLPPILARVLVNRGLVTASEVRDFLDPSLDHLHDPSLLPDLDVGVERVAKAIESGEKIRVHGDYDVDGVTGAALLVRALRALGADVSYRLPHRRLEGYDIKPAAVDECAADGVSLILTCDCGTCAMDTAERAAELGIDLVITDHHEPGSELPVAVAVINPKRRDATYPFPELAGVGVAFKFGQGLVRRLGYREDSYLSSYLDLVAMGTVGDVVPLLGENRAIVKHGLQALGSSRKIGLQTMIRQTKRGDGPLTAYYLGFVAGPRINAVGRVADATAALRLLLTKDQAEASGLMVELERCNKERKAEQERIQEEAMRQAETKNLAETRVLVLSHPGWNTGVVGIVAGKIVERYHRPAIVLNCDDESGIASGSARSIHGFSIADGLQCCDDLLETHGGHALAAGVSLQSSRLVEFEERINAVAAKVISEEDLVPRIVGDAELDLSHVTMELAELLESMEPFGTGNSEPLFISRDLTVVSSQRVGDGSHLKMCVRGSDAQVQCIAFGFGDEADGAAQLGSQVDLCYNIRLNTYNGTRSVQMQAQAIRPSSNQTSN